MKYLLVEDHGYDGQSTKEFDLLGDVCEYLESRNYSVAHDDKELYEVVMKLDITAMLESRKQAKEEARQVALAKLTQEECELLGLTKA